MGKQSECASDATKKVFVNSSIDDYVTFIKYVNSSVPGITDFSVCRRIQHFFCILIDLIYKWTYTPTWSLTFRSSRNSSFFFSGYKYIPLIISIGVLLAWNTRQIVSKKMCKRYALISWKYRENKNHQINQIITPDACIVFKRLTSHE